MFIGFSKTTNHKYVCSFSWNNYFFQFINMWTSSCRRVRFVFKNRSPPVNILYHLDGNIHNFVDKLINKHMLLRYTHNKTFPQFSVCLLAMKTMSSIDLGINTLCMFAYFSQSYHLKGICHHEISCILFRFFSLFNLTWKTSQFCTIYSCVWKKFHMCDYIEYGL